MLSVWALIQAVIQAVSVCNPPPPPLVQEHMFVQQSGWLQGKSFLRYASGGRSLLPLDQVSFSSVLGLFYCYLTSVLLGY